MMKVTFSHGERRGETVEVSALEAHRLIRAGAAVVSDATPTPEPEPAAADVVEPEPVSEQKPRKTNKEAK